ncbi:hypothetical protein A3K73_07340 [Candidatus Pacearchaeota archaeon RBG_13_36_9]|nr:MAG: hypothetical protein A3K73_07340 [Candidatus Pacearchaeota archaeon RBG_13_36_9]
MIKLNKNEAKERIEDFFKDIKDKSPEAVRKMKKIAMHYNIKLGEKRKKFCKKCYSVNLKVKSVKNKVKTVKCSNCGSLMRWKIK